MKFAYKHDFALQQQQQQQQQKQKQNLHSLHSFNSPSKFWTTRAEDHSFVDLDVYSPDPCDPFYRFFFLQVQGLGGSKGGQVLRPGTNLPRCLPVPHDKL